MQILGVLRRSLQLAKCRGYVIGDKGYLTDDDIFVYSVRAARRVAYPVCVESFDEFMAAIRGGTCMSYTGKFDDDLSVDPFDWMSDHRLSLGHQGEATIVNSDFVLDCKADEVTLFSRAGDADAVGMIIVNESEVLFGIFSKQFMEEFYVSESD